MNKINLNGAWHFIVDPENKFTPKTLKFISDLRIIEVPFCWEAQFADLRDYAGTAWYRRKFTIPEDFQNKAILLKFGAVDYYCQVWVNQKFIGDHEGGYTPFQFEIQKAVQPGKNELVVKVIDPDDNTNKFPDYPFGEIPHGKQSWYSRVSGLWQDVWIELRPKVYIKNIFVTPDVDNSKVKIKAILSHPPQAAKIKFTIISPTSQIVAEKIITLSHTKLEYETLIKIQNPSLWCPDHPCLYEAKAEIQNGDVISTKFGMRKIETKNGLIFLNNKPIYLIGALDQDFYPQTIYTPPSTDFIKDQFIKAKQLGLNLLRCHIKAPDPKYLHIADELGLFIWYEIPNWMRLTDKVKQRAKQTITDMLLRDYNHPFPNHHQYH